MKAIKYFAAALVAVAGFTACSNDDEEQVTQGGEKQSIVIKFDGIKTRATGEAQSAGQVNLKDAKIVLIAGNDVYDTKTVSNEEEEDWGKLNGGGLIIHEVPSKVDKVVVLGNVASVDLKNDSPGASLSSLQAEALDIAKQQTFDNVTLYGIDESLSETTPDEHGTVKLAEVEIKPLVARVEIGNVQCSNLDDSKYSKITLKNIGLLNIWDKVTLAGTATGTQFTMENVTEPGVEEEDKTEFGATGYSWAWDAIAENTVLDASSDVVNPAEGKWVYQVAPCSPILKMYLEATFKDGGGVDPFNNTVTASGFTGTGFDGNFLAGKIYQINLVFTADKIHPWNPDETQCIQVKVEVADWQVVALTPTYE